MAKRKKTKVVKEWEVACKKDPVLRSFDEALKQAVKTGESFVWDPMHGKIEYEKKRIKEIKND